MDNTLQLKVITALQDKLSGPLKKIQGVSGDSAKALKEMRDRLRDLERTERNVQQFRNLTNSTKGVEKSLADAQKKAQDLGAALSKVDNPTKQMRREFESAQNAVKKLKSAHQDQSQQLQRLRSDLSSAGVSTKSLSADERRLRSDIQQTNESLKNKQAALRKATEQQERLATAQSKYQASQDLAAKMAVTGTASYMTGKKVLDGIGGVIQPGIEFDERMSNVQALTRLDQGDEQLAALRKQAKDLGAATMFSATEAADAQGFLAMAGFKPDAILQAMPGMLDLAKAGNIELARTADISSNILTGMKLPTEQMGRVSDVLAGTFTRSNVDMEMLGETLKYAAPMAASLGIELETIAAATGKLGDAGIQGGMAGTALRSILNRLSAPPKAAGDALDELKVKTKDAQGNLRAFEDILVEIYKKTKKMGTAQRAGLLKAIAGEEAVSAMNILVDEAGLGKLQAFEAELKQSAGEAQKVAKTMADNITGDLDELSSAWEDVGISIYEGQSSTLRELVGILTGVVNEAGAWIKANPELTQTIIKVTAAIAGLLVVFGSISIALAAIIGPFAMLKYGMTVFGIKAAAGVGSIGLLAGAFKAVGLAVIGFGKALLLNPITWVVAGIAGGAYLIWSNWDWLKTQAGNIWSAITSTISTGWAGITGASERAGTFLSTIFKGTWDAINWSVSSAWNGVKTLVNDGWAGITGASERAGTFLSTIFKGTWDAINWSVSSAWNGVKTLVNDGWAGVKNSFSTSIAALTASLTNWRPVDSIRNAFVGVSAFFGSLIAQFTGFGGNLISGLVSGIKSMAGQAYEAISNVGSGVVRWFREKLGIQSPSRVFMTMGGNVSEGAALGIARHQLLAQRAAQALAGTIMTAGAVSPTFSFTSPIKFDARPPISQMSGYGHQQQAPIAGGNIQIHIHSAGTNAQDIARAVRLELERIESNKRSRTRSSYIDTGN